MLILLLSNTLEPYLKHMLHEIHRYVTLTFLVSGEFTTALIAGWPLLFSKRKYTLALRAWYPYDVENDLGYWCTYVYQIWGELSSIKSKVLVKKGAFTLIR